MDLAEEYVARRVARREIVESSAEVIRVVLRQWMRHAGADPALWTPELVESWVHATRSGPTRPSRG